MTKNWWFKFEYRVWQSDPALSQCSLAARGFWLEILCAMYAQDVDTVTGSFEQIARMTRCESAEVAKYSLELKTANVCNVTLGNGNVTLVSRRLQRIVNVTKQTRLRVRKHRGNGDVTLHSKSNKKEVINKTSETDEAETLSEPRKENFKKTLNLTPINPSLDLELNTWLGAVAVAVGAKNAHSLPKKSKWESVCMTAIGEQRDLGKFLKVIESEKERNKGQEQFFSPDTCLQMLQLNGSAKQSKWTHEV